MTYVYVFIFNADFVPKIKYFSVVSAPVCVCVNLVILEFHRFSFLRFQQKQTKYLKSHVAKKDFFFWINQMNCGQFADFHSQKRTLNKQMNLYSVTKRNGRIKSRFGWNYHFFMCMFGSWVFWLCHLFIVLYTSYYWIYVHCCTLNVNIRISYSHMHSRKKQSRPQQQ